MLLRNHKEMLPLRFDYEGKSLPCWEVVQLIKRPWGTCLGLWVSQLLSSLCALPLDSSSPSPHCIRTADVRERESPIFILEHFTTLTDRAYSS